VLGYYTPGDGGDGWYSVTNTIANTNALGGRIVAFGGVKSWECISQVGPRQFGAKGDAINDDTSAFQGWIDWQEQNFFLPVNLGQVPPGQYIISSVQIRHAQLHGEHRAREFTWNRGPTLAHKDGATNDMFIYDVSRVTNGSSTPSFKNLTFWGNAERNHKNLRPIVAVSSRTNFQVDITSLPPNPFGIVSGAIQVGNLVSRTAWPKLGWCFFFTSEGRFMGSALIESIDYSTGDVSIAAGYDWYETRVAAGGILSNQESVSFSTFVQERSTYENITDFDASSAGYSAIYVKNQVGTPQVSGMWLENLYFNHWHTALRFGGSIYTQMRSIHGQRCQFGLWNNHFAYNPKDCLAEDIFYFGAYRKNRPTPGTTIADETIPLTNDAASGAAPNGTNTEYSFRNTVFGFYGLDQTGVYNNILINNTTIGGYVQNAWDTIIHRILIEATTIHGIMFGDGYDDRINVLFSNAQFRSRLDVWPRPSTATTNTYCFYDINADPKRFQVGNLSVGAWGGVSNKFTAISSLALYTDFYVGQLDSDTDASAIDGTSVKLKIGNYKGQSKGYATTTLSAFRTESAFNQWATENYFSHNLTTLQLGMKSGRPIWYHTGGAPNFGFGRNNGQFADKNTALFVELFDTNLLGGQLVGWNSVTNFNYMSFGGNNPNFVSPTQIEFYVATTNNVVGASKLAGYVDGNDSSVNTSLLVRRNGAVERIQRDLDSGFLYSSTPVTTGGGAQVKNSSPVLTNIVSMDGWIRFLEVSDPAAPASDRGTLYLRDNGSGKSQLVIRFPTGAIQVIATEP